MNRTLPPGSTESHLFVEALEPRIAPAGLLNEAKFTSITAGGSVLLDASDPNGFQGISTGFGAFSGAYLLYVTAGKALVYTSDFNGNGKVDFNEITGISAGVDSQGRSLDLISFTNINGDIATNLLPGVGSSALTDSDGNPNNGRDGRVLLDNGIHSITMRTLNVGDIDLTVPGNTLANRLALTSFSIFGTVYTGADFGAAGAGLTIDDSGGPLLASVFSGLSGSQLYTGSVPSIGGIKTGTAASYEHFHFGQSSSVDIQGTFLPFTPKVGEHGGDIIGVKAAAATTVFDVGTLITGAGGTNARGGNLAEIVFNGDRGTYSLIAGDGGAGGTGATGGSIIDFNDLGTVNSAAFIHTGAGGVGLLGAGGQAGTATFANARIASHLVITLGDGGNGFSAGGNGASQTAANFLIPEGGVAAGGLTEGTYHDIGDIGDLRFTGVNGAGQSLYAPRAIDFDGDGLGDTIFSTQTPDQLVLLFGDGLGSFTASKTIYLDAPGTSQGSFVVADFNGDGRPDVASASADLNSFGGIHLFLNQIGDNLRNPVGGKIFTGNPLGNHPFSDALQSALPTVSDRFAVFQGRSAVFALAAGDFNGDGIMDIGLANDYTSIRNNELVLARYVTVLFGDDVRNPTTGAQILDPLTGRPQGAGYFIANTAAPGQSPVVATIPEGLEAPTRVVLAASSPAANAGGNELLFYGAQGANDIRRIETTTNAVTNAPIFTLQAIVGLGTVDTNRGGDTALQNANLQDYTLVDLDADGVLDVVVLTSQPVGFIVTLQGVIDPFLGFTLPAISSQSGGNQSGISYVQGGVFGNDATPLTINPIDFGLTAGARQDGIFNQFAIEALTGNPQTAQIREISLQNDAGAPDFYAGGAGVVGVRTATQSFVVASNAVAGVGTFYPLIGTTNNPAFPLIDRPVGGYTLLETNTDDYRYSYIEFFAPFLDTFVEDFRYLTSNGIFFTAGNGGNSTAGVGGNGGVLGSGLSVGAGGAAAGSIQVLVPAYLAYQGILTFDGGNGGNGFLGGGSGGDVTGVTSRFQAPTAALGQVALTAGNGGNGISGDGGRGGDLAQFSMDVIGTSFLTAGNAGVGLRGGRGGSILGNQTGVFFDTQATNVVAIAGQGGVGALGGGAGGSISNFDAVFRDVRFGGGSLFYSSGSGGNAAAGDGGAGGGITDSSPNANVNAITGTLTLNTGSGGNGLSGGAGGAIVNFLNRATDPGAIPYQMSILTGRGGIGVVGAGGAGGTITNFQSNALGLLSPLLGGSDLVRIIAGAGGASYGGTGGAGGSIVNMTAQAVSSPLAVAAGAGGAGLGLGGDGGSVRDSTLNSASQTLGKVLIIAGAGGDALAVSNQDVFVPNDPNTNDLAHILLAFGGASGLGGNGGNVSNIVQPISVQTSVDIIAGNGGSTLNYGNSISATSGVGAGGSVTNLNLAGTVGNSTRNLTSGVNPPIRSYTDTDGDRREDVSVTQYAQSLGGSVDASLGVLAGFIPAAGFDSANFAAGNVGIVAGISGRVQGGAPPRGGVNGSVQNVSAGSFMSIVAGSVDSVAPVRTVSGLTIKNLDGVLGADKSLVDLPPFGGPNNRVEYFDLNGRVVSNLEPGYRLIDGAIFAQNIIQPAVPPNITGPRVIAAPQNG